MIDRDTANPPEVKIISGRSVLTVQPQVGEFVLSMLCTRLVQAAGLRKSNTILISGMWIRRQPDLDDRHNNKLHARSHAILPCQPGTNFVM
ncbi:hypothetical protein AG1IA_05472 [Rhizoctonia solani AG-1 IA]|uniref:Uncharacterized protein n=1 Tax=Thanatephorus cucumeris (strain AG1-IA) TaxID=983506 RepID=L8WVW4_THACA|nr:hypothetical protein AG1IA_05472 [Rhizoctonia solani AG-1 IA]